MRVNAYLTGLSIVNDGVDWVMTIHDVSEGNYLAAIGFLPFISGRLGASGKYFLKIPGGKTVAHFDKQACDAIAEAAGKANFREAYKVFEKKLSVEQRLAIVNRLKPEYNPHGVLKAVDYRKKMAKIMEDAGKSAPDGLVKPWVHHDLSFTYRNWFAAHGLDIDDPRYCRWVEGTKPGRHQNWSSEFQDEWEKFILAEPRVKTPGGGYTQKEIWEFMDKLRKDIRFRE